MNPRYKKIFIEEWTLNGISEMSLLIIFLINQRFTINLTGNLLLVILVWNLFLRQLEKEISNGLLNDSLSIPSSVSKEEWEALRELLNDWNSVIKQAGKSSCMVVVVFFLFYLGFLSQSFPIHRTAGEGGGYLFNSFLPLPPVSQILDISWAITAESSPLRIGSSRARTGNLWFPNASR